MKAQKLGILVAFLVYYTVAWPISWHEGYKRLVGRAETTSASNSPTSSSDQASTSDTSILVISESSSDSGKNSNKASKTKSDTSIPVVSVVNTSDQTSKTVTKTGTTSDGKKTTSHSDKSTKKTSSSTTTTQPTSVAANLPAGGIAMITPVSTESTYIKVGDYATFTWSYTSLIISPSAVNIEASCSANSQMYTLTKNQTITDTEFVWDTEKFQASESVDLLTSKYTMYIYDADSNISEAAEAGRLQVFSLPFGVYRPQSYTPFPEDDTYVNGVDKTMVKWLMAMGTITILTIIQVTIS